MAKLLKTLVHSFQIQKSGALPYCQSHFWLFGTTSALCQGLTFVSVYENQSSLKLLHLLYNSMREVDSHIWMLLHLLCNSMREVCLFVCLTRRTMWRHTWVDSHLDVTRITAKIDSVILVKSDALDSSSRLQAVHSWAESLAWM